MERPRRQTRQNRAHKAALGPIHAPTNPSTNFRTLSSICPSIYPSIHTINEPFHQSFTHPHHRPPTTTTAGDAILAPIAEEQLSKLGGGFVCVTECANHVLMAMGTISSLSINPPTYSPMHAHPSIHPSIYQYIRPQSTPHHPPTTHSPIHPLIYPSTNAPPATHLPTIHTTHPSTLAEYTQKVERGAIIMCSHLHPEESFKTGNNIRAAKG